MDSNTVIMIISIIGTLVGSVVLFLIIAVYHGSRVKKNLKTGKGIIAHWYFEPDEWRQYLIDSGNVNNPRMTPPEIIISQDNILIGNELHSMLNHQKTVTYIQGNPSMLEFKLTFSSSAINKVYQLKIPVPRSQEFATNDIVYSFNMKA